MITTKKLINNVCLLSQDENFSKESRLKPHYHKLQCYTAKAIHFTGAMKAVLISGDTPAALICMGEVSKKSTIIVT